MSNEEKALFERFGNKTPFKVPEGYFESFEQSLMASLTEQETAREVQMTPRNSRRWRPWSYAAAGICGVMFVLGSLFNQQADNEQTASAAANRQASQTEEYTFDQAAEYAMIDNADMYAMMVGD